MKREIKLGITKTDTSGVVHMLDANTIKEDGVVYLTTTTIAKELTGGLANAEGVQIVSSTFLSTITARELDGTTIKYSLESKGVNTHYERNGQNVMWILPCGTLALPQTIFVKNSVGLLADFDLLSQAIIQKILGIEVRCSSKDKAITKVWRQFRKLYKHK